MKVEIAKVTSAKASLESQVAEIQERMQEKEGKLAKQSEKIAELEDSLQNVQSTSKKAATEQISAKNIGDSQVLVLNSKLKVLQASVDEKQ